MTISYWLIPELRTPRRGKTASFGDGRIYSACPPSDHHPNFTKEKLNPASRILIGGNTTQKIDDDMRWLAREGAMAVTVVHRYLQELGD
jgi:hypothetical protein